MKATGPTIAHIKFDPAKTKMLRGEQVDQLAYHVARLLTGDETADSEWTYFGFDVMLEAVETAD